MHSFLSTKLERTAEQSEKSSEKRNSCKESKTKSLFYYFLMLRLIFQHILHIRNGAQLWYLFSNYIINLMICDRFLIGFLLLKSVRFINGVDDGESESERASGDGRGWKDQMCVDTMLQDGKNVKTTEWMGRNRSNLSRWWWWWWWWWWRGWQANCQRARDRESNWDNYML